MTNLAIKKDLKKYSIRNTKFGFKKESVIEFTQGEENVFTGVSLPELNTKIKALLSCISDKLMLFNLYKRKNCFEDGGQETTELKKELFNKYVFSLFKNWKYDYCVLYNTNYLKYEAFRVWQGLTKIEVELKNRLQERKEEISLYRVYGV